MPRARGILGRLHWAWVPAAVFYGVVGWQRYGPVPTLLAVVAGLGVGVYAERRAKDRRTQR